MINFKGNFYKDLGSAISLFFRKHWLQAAQVVLPLLALNTALNYFISMGVKEWAYGGYVTMGIFGLIFMALTGSFIYMIFNLLKNKRLKTYLYWASGFYYAPPLVLTSLLLIGTYYFAAVLLGGALGTLGVVVLMIASFYIKTRLFPLFSFIVNEGMNPVQAVKSSWALTENYVLEIMGILVILGLFVNGPSLFILMPKGALPTNDPDFISWKLFVWMLIELGYVLVSVFTYTLIQKNEKR